MKIIQEYKDGDVYRSDVDISKAEWLEILKDKDVSENYKESVACFYYLPDYKGSCVSAGKWSLCAAVGGCPPVAHQPLVRLQPDAGQEDNRS